MTPNQARRLRAVVRYICFGILVAFAALYLIAAVVKNGWGFIIFLAVFVGALFGAFAL